jgi:hypothetical protein
MLRPKHGSLQDVFAPSNVSTFVENVGEKQGGAERFGGVRFAL